jgi:UrcA family protein
MFAHATHSFTLTASALAIMTATAITSPARAADFSTQSIKIHYRDLDLTTDAGAAALKQRIARAAAEICRPVNGPTLHDHARYNACRTAAIASASPQMNTVIASARSSDRRYAMNHDASAVLSR